MLAHLHGSNISFVQGGRSSTQEPLEGNPGYTNLQDISINPDSSARYPRHQTQESSVGTSLDPQVPSYASWDVPQTTTTTTQKRSRSDEYTEPPSKRTRSSKNLDIIGERQAIDEPWSIFVSRSDQASGATSTQHPSALPSMGRRSRLLQASGSEQHGTLLSSTKAEDISKALLSEVKGCKSWEGIQRTIKIGLLNLLKPDSLKADSPTSADSSLSAPGNETRRKVSCDVCGKTMNRHCELKSVFLFSYFIFSFLSLAAFLHLD